MTRLFPIILLIPFGLQAAIEGTVTDPSGRPVRGALVECAGQSARTAIDGSFTFPSTDSCDARVTASGFGVQTVALSGGSRASIQLSIEGVSERVVVTATRTETTLEQTGISADIITRSDLELRQNPFLPDVLRELPGIAVNRTGREGSLTTVFTRGAPRTATMVLLDGVPMNDPGGEVNLGHLTTDAIDRVEVVRAPSSVMFGAEASAGVIQMFTRSGDPEAKMPHGSATYERGSFGTDRWTAGLSGGSGARFDYALNAAQFHTVGEFQNDYYRNTSGGLNAGFRIAPNTQLRGVFRSYDAGLGVPGQVGYGLYDFDARETTRDNALSLRLDDARGAHYFQTASFTYHRLRDWYIDPAMEGPYPIALLVRDVYSPVHRVYRVAMLDPNNLPATLAAGTRIIRDDVTLYNGDPFLSATERKRFEYQGTLTHSGGAVMFGYDFERQGGSVSGSDISRDNNGGFIHAQQAVGSRLFLSGGVRIEDSSAFGRKIVPRGAASLLVLPNTWLRFSAGRGITEPSLIQNFAKEFYYTGNPALRPEKSSNFELGLMREWFGRRLKTEVAAFHNSFEDLIAFVSLPPPVWGTWQNIEASRARGLEFSARAKLTGWAYVQGAYTRLWTRIVTSNSPSSLVTGVGQELTRRPGNSGSVSLSLMPKRWWLQTGAVFVGERQDTDFLGVTRNPGYQNVWLSASLRWSRYISPFLRMDNLMNSRYEEALGYPSLSRSARGGVKLAW